MPRQRSLKRNLAYRLWLEPDGNSKLKDITEDMAAEQKAKPTYDNILRMVDDPDVIEPIRYLGEREIIHFLFFVIVTTEFQKIFDFSRFAGIIALIAITAESCDQVILFFRFYAFYTGAEASFSGSE